MDAEPTNWDAPPVRAPVQGLLPAEALDREDLDEVLKDFADGDPLLWAAAIPLPKPGPDGRVAFEGTDWRVAIPDQTFRAPGFGISEDDRKDVEIEPPVAILSVSTGASTPTTARDVGRPRLHALIGYIQLRTGIFAGSWIGWEGLASPMEDGAIRFATGRNQAVFRASDAGIEQIREKLTGFALENLSTRHQLALEWLAEAWRSASTSVRFANLWFAVVVAVDSTFTKSEKEHLNQMERVRQHLLALPISPVRRDELLEAFRKAYAIRNDTVHEGSRKAATPEALSELYAAVVAFLQDDIGST
jgi:hypothetical protein